jgi:hypothetical protein
MAIGNAVQRGTLIYVYDQQGKPITSISAPGRWPNDGLKGFDASSINIQKGTLLYTYDEMGRKVINTSVVSAIATGKQPTRMAQPADLSLAHL